MAKITVDRLYRTRKSTMQKLDPLPRTGKLKRLEGGFANSWADEGKRDIKLFCMLLFESDGSLLCVVTSTQYLVNGKTIAPI